MSSKHNEQPSKWQQAILKYASENCTTEDGHIYSQPAFWEYYQDCKAERLEEPEETTYMPLSTFLKESIKMGTMIPIKTGVFVDHN